MHRVIIAEGDSWFSIPDINLLFRKLIGPDLVDYLKKLKIGRRKIYKVKRLASHGDSISSMNDPEQICELAKELRDLGDDETLTAILLSGGGNDLKDRLCKMLNSSSDDPINEAKVGEFMAKTKCEYVNLLGKIDCLVGKCLTSRKIPVIIHGYDYSVPDGRGFKGIGIWKLRVGMTGPWLKPVFKSKGLTSLSENKETMKQLIDSFNSMVCSIATTDANFSNINVIYANLRGKLKNDLNNNKYEEHWRDELHATKDGCEILALELHNVIYRETGG